MRTTRTTSGRSWRSSAGGGTRRRRAETSGDDSTMSARDAVLAWSAAVERRYREARPRSEALMLRARGLLPGGETRVGSAVPPFGPIFVQGKGQELTDVDGNVVLDTTHNATSLIHGHANPTIVE